jgi:hypothetical protein
MLRDGAVAFAPLLASNLATMMLRQLGAGGYGPPYALYSVRLTEQGRRLVDAWIRGDLPAFRSALSRDDAE